jgi:hypothetical protein
MIAYRTTSIGSEWRRQAFTEMEDIIRWLKDESGGLGGPEIGEA